MASAAIIASRSRLSGRYGRGFVVVMVLPPFMIACAYMAGSSNKLLFHSTKIW